MGDLTNYLKTQNIDPKEVLIPTKEQTFFPVYNQTGNSNLIDLDYEGDSNLRSLDEQRNDIRAKQQSGFEKVLNSTGQMVGTFGTALASSAATLISGAYALGEEARTNGEADGMDIMLNNPIMKGISDFDKYIKEEIVPTYYTKEQQDNIILNGGWASTGTDLLNGLGFMASAVLPSQAITKLFGNMSKMVAASKLNKLEPILENAIKFRDITSQEAGMISKTARYLDKAGPIVGATIGRIGESSMEAYQTYESMLNAKDEYGNKIYTEEEAKNARNNVFMGNMALAAADLAQYTRWFKGNPADDLIKQGLETTVKTEAKGAWLKDAIKEAGQEAAEEGYQFLLSKGAEKKGKSFLEGMSEATGDLFTTTEGLKSMLLGAVLGGGVGTGLKQVNAKQQKLALANMANELTANADTSQRYITDPETGKQIVNPELTKIATRFANYEKQKDEALANGDEFSYNVLEKMQFADLVEAKNRAGQFDEFIDQLEEMGRSNPEEVKSMFGNLPIKNGKEMTPMQVATEKIQQAKQIKQIAEGLDLLPQLTNVSPSARTFIKNTLFTQEALRNEILNIDTKIAEVNSRAVPGIITKDNPVPGNMLHAWDKNELDKLNVKKQELVDAFTETSQHLKDYISKPEIAEKKVDDIQTKNVEDAIDDEQNIIRKDIKDTDKAKSKLDKIKESATDKPITIETNEGEITVQNIDGQLVNVETGENVEAILTELFKEKIVESDNVDFNNVPEDIDEYKSTDEIKDDFNKKPNIFSTSTRGHEVDYSTGKRIKQARENQETGIYEYALYPLHKQITKWFSNPKNNTQDKKYTAKLELLAPTEEALQGIEEKRKVLQKLYPDAYFPTLNINDPGYQTLRLKLYEDGKLVKESEDNVIHFHTVDHFYDTQQFEDIRNDVDEKLQFEITKKAVDKLIAERAKLIANIDSAVLNIETKSPGTLNYLPNTQDGKQVLNLENVFKNNKSKGLAIVESVDGESNEALIRWDKIAKPIVYKANGLKAGEKVYIVKSANNSDFVLSNLTFNKISPEHIEGLVNMITFRLTTGLNTIKVGKTEFNLTGENGLIYNLLYVGARDKSEAQLYFTKDGRLQVGTQLFTKETALQDIESFKNILRNNINVYNSLPVYTLETLKKEVVLPTEIDAEGNAKGKIMTFKELLLDGKNPLIGTNVNPEIPFINSYFTFEQNANGNLVYDAKVENVPYADNLEPEIKPIAPPEVVAQQDIDAKKDDIERRRQEELNNSVKIKTYKVGQTIYDNKGNEFEIDSLNIKTGEILRSSSITRGGNLTTRDDVYTENPNKINAKYDAELAELEKTENQEVVNSIQKTNEIVNQELNKIEVECKNAPVTKTEVNTTNKGIQTSIKNIDNFDF